MLLPYIKLGLGQGGGGYFASFNAGGDDRELSAYGRMGDDNPAIPPPI